MIRREGEATTHHPPEVFKSIYDRTVYGRLRPTPFAITCRMETAVVCMVVVVGPIAGVIS